MTAANETYNGYPNRATWNVILWLASDESTYHEARLFAENSNYKVSPRTAERFCLDTFGNDQTPDGDKFTNVVWSRVAEWFNKR